MPLEFSSIRLIVLTDRVQGELGTIVVRRAVSVPSSAAEIESNSLKAR
jgi:hypothetical protein